jgi:hypothetical protein
MEVSAGTKVDETDLKEVSVSPGSAMIVYFPNFASGINVLVGVYNLQVSDYFNYATDSIISGFCIEDVYSTGSYSQYGIWTIDDNSKYEKAAWIAAQYFSNPYSSSNTTGIRAEAAQLAIWEIVMETSTTYDLTNGAVRVNSGNSFISAANALVNGALAQTNINQAGWYLALHPDDPNDQDDYQDYIVQGPIPEPTTLMLIGTGILGVFGYAKKRKFFKKAA